MKDLTEKQAKVLAFIKARIRASKCSPSIREICRHMGLTHTNAGHQLVLALERKGCIVRAHPGKRGFALPIEECRPFASSAVAQEIALLEREIAQRQELLFALKRGARLGLHTR